MYIQVTSTKYIMFIRYTIITCSFVSFKLLNTRDKTI